MYTGDSSTRMGGKGRCATKRKFRERFYAPGAGRRIVQEITNCINCIQKLNTVRKDQHVFHRTLETKPWSRVYINLVGPLPENEYRGQQNRVKLPTVLVSNKSNSPQCKSATSPTSHSVSQRRV